MKLLSFNTLNKFLAFAGVVVLGFSIIYPAPVSAARIEDYTEDELRSLGIHFIEGKFNSGDNGSCENPVVAGSSNAERTWNYFRAQGFTAEQTAGIMGNFQVESHHEPRLVQYGKRNSRGEISRAGQPSSLDDNVPPGDAGYGLAQWTSSGRKDNLRNFAASRGVKAGTLELQLDFVMKELNDGYPAKKSSGGGRVIDGMKKQKTVRDATLYWMENYERPGQKKEAERINFANGFYQLYGSKDGAKVDETRQNCVKPDTGGSGLVTTSGYAWPVEPQRRSQNGTQPNLSAMPCKRKSCHHDGTAAFDLSRKPGGNSGIGAGIYAISDGKVEAVKIYDGIAGCYHFQFKSSKDNFYYWYGHMQKPAVASMTNVKAGQKIAEIGPSKCAKGTTPHLHIDRGCTKGGKPQKGGSDSCRDPDFTPFMNKLFESLPD